MTLDDLRQSLRDQGFRIFQDQRTGDHIIADADYDEVARQPSDEDELRQSVAVALTNAGFLWPQPPSV